jgi:hypothetical protein
MTIEILNYEASAAGVIFPAKTFIIEEDTSFVIISPGPLNSQAIDRITKTTKDLVFIAPNNFHNLHLKSMHDIFPDAKFYGPKRAAKVSGVTLLNTKDFSSPNIEMIRIEGNNSLSETCFYYKPEKTLIVTDLFFNMKHDMNMMTKITMKMAGAYKKLATSRMIKFSTKDKDLFNQSLKRLADLDFTKVIPNHGDSISKEIFVKSFARD